MNVNLDTVLQATEMMGQGMAGIFVVLGVIALAVAFLKKIDQKK